MRSFHFDPRSRAPIVTALISGPRGTRKLRLVFDTGAEMTQFHAARMHEVGYSQSDAVAKASVVGAGGIEAMGYVVNLQKFFVLGSKAEAFKVGVFEMQHLDSQRLDGLLGWDVIRAFHLEMVGPEGILKIF
jgi:hypothetical protein